MVRDRVFKDIALDDVKVGDIATHRSGELDPRRVAMVEGEEVWLEFTVSALGPFPKRNYRFKRVVRD